MARAGAPQRLRVLLDAVGRGADLLICPSEVTAQGIERHVVAPPERMVLPLGVTNAEPKPDELPQGIDLDAPYFVAVGTLEGRKNLGLLLDVWTEMDSGATLYLCGAQGWRAEDVPSRLDRGIAGVVELPDLSDGAVAALLRGARALLFPSLAEGFGLPPWEALAQGTLPVCADLAIWREALGDRAVYLPPEDRYLWREEIERLARAPKAEVAPGELPIWDAHFEPLTRAGW